MGYYMVEIKATLRNPAERTVVYFFSGLSNENAQFVLPLHSERITKRLIKLDQASFLGITCKLSEHENASIISSLKIVRVARSFFLDRIFKKMGLKRSSDFYQEISEEDLNAYFQQYDNFLSNSGFDDATYELFLKEEASDPALNTKRHLRKMKQWGIR